MNIPNNCKECRYFRTCRAVFLGRGCKYSDEEAREHGEDNNS